MDLCYKETDYRWSYSILKYSVFLSVLLQDAEDELVVYLYIDRIQLPSNFQ